MSDSDPHEITLLLNQHCHGDQEAAYRLIPLVYGELRQLAQHYMKHRNLGRTLQPTALVHEVYLRLFHGQEPEWQNREHFFQIAGQQMRWLLVDYARASLAQKRGGDQIKSALDEAAGPVEWRDENLLAPDEALKRLEALYPRVAQVVELRFFVGLTEEQTGEVLGVSARTVKRDWAFAKAWLLDQLGASGS